jgi:hypothetical protein
MKLPPNAGQHLVLPGIVAAGLVAAGIVGLMGASELLDKARDELNQAKSNREQAQTRLSRATDEEHEVRERLADYFKLLDRGVIGEEQRLNWIDRIAQIKAARKLFDVKYSIEPQRPADYPGIAGKGEVELLASAMKLDMSLLHEEDLFRFISDLRTALNAYVVVKSCTMDRAERGASDRGVAPRLHASCDIDLVTIRDQRLKQG